MPNQIGADTGGDQPSELENGFISVRPDIDNFLTSGVFYVDPDAAIERVQAPKASWADFAAYFKKWENMKVLVGAAYSWFALDVCVTLTLSTVSHP